MLNNSTSSSPAAAVNSVSSLGAGSMKELASVCEYYEQETCFTLGSAESPVKELASYWENFIGVIELSLNVFSDTAIRPADFARSQDAVSRNFKFFLCQAESLLTKVSDAKTLSGAYSQALPCCLEGLASASHLAYRAISATLNACSDVPKATADSFKLDVYSRQEELHKASFAALAVKRLLREDLALLEKMERNLQDIISAATSLYTETVVLRLGRISSKQARLDTEALTFSQGEAVRRLLKELHCTLTIQAMSRTQAKEFVTAVREYCV